MLTPSGSSRVPIIYSPRYDPNFGALGHQHPSEVRSPSRIFAGLSESLRSQGVSFAENQRFEPQPLSDEDFLLVHSRKYMRGLGYADTIARVIELPRLARVPIDDLQQHLVLPARFGAGGTLLGFELARQYGWAINLSGGFHHAKVERGEGFCLFADVAIAVRKLCGALGIRDLLIVDLDAHQGNGNARVLGKDARVRIMDVFNSQIYPGEPSAIARVTYPYPVMSGITDRDYLPLVSEGLERAIRDAVPDQIVFIAGYDVLSGDPLGRMSLSVDGCIARDRMVWSAAIRHRVPMLMCLAGGYGPSAASTAGTCAAKCVLQFMNSGHS